MIVHHLTLVTPFLSSLSTVFFLLFNLIMILLFMNFIQRLKKTSKSNHTFHLRSKHLQSCEFMQNNVVFSQYVVPTDHFKVKVSLEGRCAALTNPSFINTDYHLRAYYIPHSVVYRHFADFVEGTLPYANGQRVECVLPYVTDVGLTGMFLRHNLTTSYDDIPETEILGHRGDFFLRNEIAYKPYTFTPKGRFIYKLLKSLGYNFNFTTSTSSNDKFNALALLSYFRVFADYFVPHVRYSSSACVRLLEYVYNNPVGQELTSYDYPTQYEYLVSAFEEVVSFYYPSSYQTSSWLHPQSPLGDGEPNVYNNIGQLPLDINKLVNTPSGFSDTRYLSNVRDDSTGAETTTLATNASRFLGNPWVQRNVQRIANWLTRTRFSGSDSMINLLSRFGVKPDDLLQLRSHFVGHFSQPLLVQDVTATAQTFNSDGSTAVAVGDFAGKMFSNVTQSNVFDFRCDDYGCIIITSIVTPHDIDYYQGVDLNLLKQHPMDFYQPEFDNAGTQLQSRRELVSGQFVDMASSLMNFSFNKANGYVPRFSEYKKMDSLVTGDFACNSLNLGYDSFHHFRKMFDVGRSGIFTNVLVPATGIEGENHGVNLSQDPQLLQAQSSLLMRSNDKTQFNRIFNVQSDDVDHVYTMYYFDVLATRPMSDISGALELDGSESLDLSQSALENR